MPARWQPLVVTTAPGDQGALQGDLGAELERGQTGGGTFVESRDRPELHREIQEAKWCNAKICREVEGSGMNRDLKNENPQRPRDSCKKGSSEDKGWQASPSASHSEVKALGRPIW